METKTSDSKLYYTMGEVAELYQVKHSLIRYWEKEFGIINPKKNKKGNRLFTKKDMEAFDLIYDLVKKKGYTLEGAKMRIKDTRLPEKYNTKEVIEKLKKIRSFLVELEGQIDQ